MKIFTVVLIALAAVFLVGFVLWPRPSRAPGPVACTLEAKICPDGSPVGRTGPQCEFAECPSAVSSSTTGSTAGNTTGISGMVLLGPTCPVERIPPDPQCADRPFGTALVLTTADQIQVIKTFSSGMDGKFTVQVAPGDYAIRSAVAANMLPRCASNGTIHVILGAFTKTTVSCDTGIR